MNAPNLARDDRGATIVEFALVAPLLIMIVVGGINLSMLGFSAANLRSATEAAARCAAVNTGTCSSASATQAYAASRMTHLTSARASFTGPLSEACGKKVSGSLSFVVQTGLREFTVPLAASACFPQ